MRRLVPDFILRQAEERDHSGQIGAIAVSIDLIGFTAITQACMQSGHAGVEALIDTINSIFTPAIHALESRGGFIAGFAGDAFTAMFEEGHWDEAVTAALDVRDLTAANGIHVTPCGEHQLWVRVGIGQGDILWELIPHPVQSTWWFCGPGIDNAVQAQSLARPNEVICAGTPGLFCDPDRVDCQDLDGWHFRITAIHPALSSRVEEREHPSQDAFVPPALAQLDVEGEFRDLLSCFVSLRSSNAERRQRVTDLAISHGGYISHIDCTDKGWLMYVIFGAPRCYDQNQRRAVSYALELLNSYGEGVRIGLSEGKAYAGFVGSATRGEYTGMGTAVNLAARFMMKAPWGEAWFDGTLQKALGHEFESIHLGQLEFKGFPRPIDAYRLVGKRPDAGFNSFGNRFTGRRSELESLLKSCAHLQSGSFAGLTYIYGAAGQGKSRLLHELKQRLGSSVQELRLQSDPIQPSALGPFTAWIRNRFTPGLSIHQERVSEFRTSWAAFASSFSALPDAPKILEELARIESLVAGLLGLEWEGGIYSQLDPGSRVSTVRLAIKSLIEIMSRLQPLLLIVEDLHWLDPESAQLVTLITRKASTAIKIVVTSRLRDDGGKPTLRLDRDVPVDSLELDGLDASSVQELMLDVLSQPVSGELLDYLRSSSQGNPFIAVQLTLYLLENGHLSCQDGIFSLRSATARMPDSVEAILVARIDRLERELRRMVQTASVLGYEFTRSVLAEMLRDSTAQAPSFSPESLSSKLELGELERLWNSVSEISYIFSHSLLRDAAYGMQLLKQLRRLHLLAAQAITRLYEADKLWYAQIAFHYEKAGETLSAADYYLKAGDHERDRYLCAQALVYYEAARRLTASLWGTGHPGYARCLSRIGTAHTVNSAYDLALPCFQEALAIQEEALGREHADTASTLFNLGNYHNVTGNREQALSCYRQALDIRTRLLGRLHPDTASVINNIAGVYSATGRFDLAMDHYQQALDIRRELWGDQHPQIATTLNSIGNLHWNRGAYSRAMEYYRQALDMRMEVLGPRHPETADSLNGLGNYYSEMARFDEALQCFHQALDIRREIQGSRHSITADSLNNLGIIYDITGEYHKALPHLSEALEIKRQLFGDTHVEVAAVLNNIGSVYDHQGNYDLALSTHQEALAIWEEALGHIHAETASCLNNIGCSYENKGDNATAMGYYQEAYSIYSQTLGPASPETSTALVNIGCVHENLQDYPSAIGYYQQALAIRKEVFGPDHPATQRTQANITRLEELVKKERE